MMNLSICLENVRAKTPLVHSITNYVTVNDCANILLACGASPIMSDDPEEVEEITSICGGLNINIGTLNGQTIESMFLAGGRANELEHPVLLDPVGAGASELRTDTALDLLEEVKFAAVRGNISEIITLAYGNGTTKGVDADEEDQLNASNRDSVIRFAREFAEEYETVVAITGATDVITDGRRVCLIQNGHPMMSRITGTGCMLSAMTTAFLAANPEQPFEAVCAAVCAMGLAGELAHKRLSPLEGNASYRNYIIDAIYHMSGAQLEEGARYELL